MSTTSPCFTLVCAPLRGIKPKKVKSYLVNRATWYLKVYSLLCEYLVDIDKLPPNNQHLVHRHVLLERPPKV